MGQLPEEGMQEANDRGAKVCLNLGSAQIVSDQRSRLWRLLEARLITAIMMNETEASALCDCGDTTEEPTKSVAERACIQCCKYCDLVVVTLGSQGIWICNGAGANAELIEVTPLPSENVVDSTGAGDFFAGGFLAAWHRGLPSSECCRWGHAAAVEVLSCFGTDVGDNGWAQIRKTCTHSSGEKRKLESSP